MPRTRSRPPDGLIRTAAELRAAGTPWDAIGPQVGRSPATVRQWPRLYPKRWAAAYREGARQLRADAAAEAVHTLRRQLRSADDKASRDAADKLLKHADPPAHRKRPAQPKPSAASSRAVRVAEYVEGLTDAQVEDLIRELSDQPPPAAGGPAAVAAVPGGGS